MIIGSFGYVRLGSCLVGHYVGNGRTVSAQCSVDLKANGVTVRSYLITVVTCLS